MSRGHFHTIAYVYIALAAAHGVCALLMVFGSLLRRTLSFSPWASSFVVRGGKSSNHGITTMDRQDRHASSAEILRRNTVQIYKRFADRRGLFGVNGRHFHTVLICRELLETALQTAQAIRMSKYLPRVLLNRFYVGLLLSNCWSSVVIYSRFFWRGEARRRLATIACDSVLDVMSAIGVPVTIVLSYVSQYDVVLTGFSFELLEDDEWVARMLNEAQVVLVVSWSDLAMRVVFSVGLIISVMNMTDLLCRTAKHPNFDEWTRTQNLGVSPAKSNSVVPAATTRNFQARRHVPVILHSTTSISSLHYGDSCPKVHPIAGVAPSCFVVNFNCHDLHISGKSNEVQVEWEKFDRTSGVKIQFFHCPALAVPESFQEFRRLRKIQIYNSAIKEWGADAAFTNTHHPELTDLSVVRVNMTGGLLPLGFQSSDFPLQLFQISFCETNLQTLPLDLDTKWLFGSNIYIENSHLEVAPPVLARLQPYYLTLVGNPITEFSPEIFEVTYTQYLILARTNVRELPRIVPQPIVGPTTISLSDTNIAFFWSRIDPLVESMLNALPPIGAGGSPYCIDLEQIMNGGATDFSAPFQEGHSPILMNASKENWDTLRLAVDCSPTSWKNQFPLDLWDELYALNATDA
ncbi:hypothetical protein ON010_g15215 [Phytophthora cinnamomi]|nr:hypothetical protein ON010_g15215 [Phytophthora cinnamomi]